MIDQDSDLRERFAQLRAEDQRVVPPFDPAMRVRKRPLVRRVAAATAALLLFLVIAIAIRSRPTRFSDADHATVHRVAAWQSPTDFLLRTPGKELLTTTPQIPDLKGIP